MPFKDRMAISNSRAIEKAYVFGSFRSFAKEDKLI
jgi:hypothetical protein